MASIDRRIANLERLIVPPSEADEGAEARQAIMIATLDEIAGLKGCRARNSYRGGKPPTPIQPTDPAGEALGYPYTRGQLWAFAVRRVLEREDAPSEATEGLVEEWVGFWRAVSEELGHDWNKVAAEGPPERTPPFR